MTREAYEASKNAMIEEIERAFNGVAREDGVTLHEADVIDNYGSDDERAKARLQDTETRWQDVPDEQIRYHNSNLSFLDSKGFHYYFPAYLTWDLRFADCEDEDFWSDTFDSINYKLLIYKDSIIDDIFVENFILFDLNQKKVISHYIHFQMKRIVFFIESEDNDTIIELERENIRNFQRALDTYWGQFL